MGEVDLSAVKTLKQTVMVAPCPKSPPKYPDLSGRRRLQLEVQILDREIGFLEQEELQSLEGLQSVSTCCKDVNDFVGTKSDPMVPTIDKERHKSSCLSHWFRSNMCLDFSWICSSSCHYFPCPNVTCCGCQCTCRTCHCCADSCGCSSNPCSKLCCSCNNCCSFSCCKLPENVCSKTCCSLKNCCSCCGFSACSCAGISNCCAGFPSCSSCCKTKCNCWDFLCCRAKCSCCSDTCGCKPRCCNSTLSCFQPCCCTGKPSCCAQPSSCCAPRQLSCPEYSCGCVFSCPAHTEASLCAGCNCCVTRCLM